VYKELQGDWFTAASSRTADPSDVSTQDELLELIGLNLKNYRKATVVAPPGKLGINIVNKADSKGTVVYWVSALLLF
jgi:hypothetical protein